MRLPRFTRNDTKDEIATQARNDTRMRLPRFTRNDILEHIF